MGHNGLLRLDYMRCFRAVRRNIASIIIFSLLCGAAGMLAVLAVMDAGGGPAADMYEAVSSVYSRPGIPYGRESDAVSYAETAKSLRVAEAAGRLLGAFAPDKYEIRDMISVSYDEKGPYSQSPSVIYISARSADPAKAVNVANAAAKAFVNEVRAIDGESSLRVLDMADSCTRLYTAGGRFALCAGAAAGAGFILACGLVILLDILAFRLIEVEDAELDGELEIIGVIPRYGTGSAAILGAQGDEHKLRRVEKPGDIGAAKAPAANEG